jgi:hypothetical protein
MPPKRQQPTRLHNKIPEDHSVEPGCLLLKRYCQQHNDCSKLKRTEVPAGDSYTNSTLLTICVCERHGESCQNGTRQLSRWTGKTVTRTVERVAYCENSIRLFPSNKAVSNICAICSISEGRADSCKVYDSQSTAKLAWGFRPKMALKSIRSLPL